jgi:hypothetical protein
MPTRIAALRIEVVDQCAEEVLFNEMLPRAGGHLIGVPMCTLSV